MNSQAPETKAKSPAFWVPTLYIAEGLPFIATMTVSTLMYKSLGLSDTKIAAFTSLVAWPWSLKPLWSGFLEMYKTKKHLVVATEFLGGICFALLAMSLSSDAFVAISLGCFALIAFNSATHDIVADGLYIESLTSELQAKYVGIQGACWNLGKLLAQGVLVYVAGKLEFRLGPRPAWSIVMGLFAGTLVLFSLYHSRMLPRGRQAPKVRSAGEVFREFWHVLKTFLQKKYVYWGLVYIVIFRLAEGQGGKIFPLFLRASRSAGGLGLTTDQVGSIYGVWGAGAFVLGSIIGGNFAAKLGLRRCIMLLCTVYNLQFAAYLYLAWTRPENFVIITAAIVTEMFAFGFGFVAVTLFMMQQMATGRFKMSHYAIATSAMQLGLILPGAWSGWLSDLIGYKYFFTWVMVSTLLSFGITAIVPFKSEEEIAEENAVGEAAA